MHTPSTELALKQFDAAAAFSAALAEFQKAPPEGTIIAEARRAADHGISWFARPSEPGFVEVRLRHAGGAEISAEGESITALLAGLLGHPLAQDIGVIAAAQAAEPEQEEITVGEVQALADALAGVRVTRLSPAQVAAGDHSLQVAPASPPTPAHAAAESLAAATGGAVVEKDPDESERLRLAAPLADGQKAVCVDMIKALTADQRNSFKIAFRHAFQVPREKKAIAPLITEIRHMEFCDRWSIENAGGVAP